MIIPILGMLARPSAQARTGVPRESRSDGLLAHYRGRRSDAREFALRHRVLLLSTLAGIAVNTALGARDYFDMNQCTSRMG
jgi:hypothetical protein